MLTLMIVHAHPDDEAIPTGGSLPRYAAEGVHTVLVTATRGEEGEIVLPELDRPEVRARFGEFRTAELQQAAIILNVSDLEILGYRDSGMVDTPSNNHPACFHMASPEEAAWRLVRLVRRYRPQVLMSYNEVGGYGHPDHIACHKATVAAFHAAGDPARFPDAGAPWTPSKLYYANSPRKPLMRAWEQMRALGMETPLDNPEFDITRFTVPDEQVTTRVDVSAFLPQKIAALGCHRSQIRNGGWLLSVPEELRAEFFGHEHFTLAESRLAEPTYAQGELEEDLFAGLR
ncbi:MAG: N-acetyl-1-D-myo-inositol-2-amino-2-deoxy-alpha-D-glucopyranoside deacetylase [Chloroflexales bacterium]|nr:N-acetyl-1-D-myo-inositol-2-amino-2-deoxy-alpha-D-glucopyranoside deacetylase [Chloroflexales bacterium]